MNKKKRFELILAIIIICCFLLIGCESNSNNISFGDVVYDTLNVLNNKLVKADATYINLLRTYDDSSTVLSDLCISQSAMSVYDENYFKDKDLLVIAFGTSPEYKYTINSLMLNANVLTVDLDVHIPKNSEALMIYKAILIDISKGTLPDDVSIDVQFNEIIEK